jgi:hypothetical protein
VIITYVDFLCGSVLHRKDRNRLFSKHRKHRKCTFSVNSVSHAQVEWSGKHCFGHYERDHTNGAERVCLHLAQKLPVSPDRRFSHCHVMMLQCAMVQIVSVLQISTKNDPQNAARSCTHIHARVCPSASVRQSDTRGPSYTAFSLASHFSVDLDFVRREQVGSRVAAFQAVK